MENNPLMTNKEAAAYLAIQPQTLDKWRMTGGENSIPFVKVGRSIRYQRSDLNNYIASRKFNNTVEAFNRSPTIN